MFQKAAGLISMEEGLATKISVAISTYIMRFGVRLRGEMHTFEDWRSRFPPTILALRKVATDTPQTPTLMKLKHWRDSANAFLQGARVIDLVRSGLDHKMHSAYPEMSNLWNADEQIPDLGTVTCFIGVRWIFGICKALGI